MAHEITSTDEVFSVHQPMWHGLGQVLDAYPTRETAQSLVHPWEPVSEPLYRKTIQVVDGELVEDWGEVPEAVLNVRSDNGTSLGVVSDTFSTVTNTEMWDVAEALQGGDPSAVQFETGGSLNGGRKVWILIRLAEAIQIKGDPNGAVIPYYALQNGHDGLAAFRGQATMTRIVCANTSKAADVDAEARGTEFTFRHTKNIGERVEEARQALTGWRESVSRWHRLQELLVDSPIEVAQQRAFAELFIPMPKAGAVSERVRANVDEGQAQLLGILGSQTCEGVALTAYGLVQAAIEYCNWTRAARTDESRFKRAYLDRSSLVSDAQAIAADLAGVSL